MSVGRRPVWWVQRQERVLCMCMCMCGCMCVCTCMCVCLGLCLCVCAWVESVKASAGQWRAVRRWLR